LKQARQPIVALLGQALARSCNGQESCRKPRKNAFLENHVSTSLLLPGTITIRAANLHRITNSGFPCCPLGDLPQPRRDARFHII
jgi:hypothetical protein